MWMFIKVMLIDCSNPDYLLIGHLLTNLQVGHFPCHKPVTLNRILQRRQLPINYRIIYNAFVQDIPDQYIFIYINTSETSKWTLQTSQRFQLGWGTVLQAGRSQISFPMVSMELFCGHNPSSRTIDQGSTQPLTEMSTRNISWGAEAVNA